MSARERILAIRLMEKLRKNPAYAQALGIEVTQGQTAKDVETLKNCK